MLMRLQFKGRRAGVGGIEYFITPSSDGRTDDDRTLGSYGLRPNMRVRVVWKYRGPTFHKGLYQICIKTPSAKWVAVHVKANDTIKFVRLKIHALLGIPPCQMRLMCGVPKLKDGRVVYYQKQLEDGRRVLADYSIIHGSEVEIILRLRGC